LNSKYFLLLFTILLTSCGVKGPPMAPAGTAVPSFINPYMKKSATAKVDSKSEDKKKKSSKSE